MFQKKQQSLFTCWKRNDLKGGESQDRGGDGDEDVAVVYDSNQNFEPDLFDDDDDELFAQAYEESVSVEGESLKDDREQPSTSMQEKMPMVPQSTPLETLPGFDVDNGRTWIYPINYPLRAYQFSIVEKALYNNTLVCLPTGLGKTFIAAVLMYNYYRWYPRSKIIFMAPTRPLVAQQMEACFNIAGMPQADTSQMTGSMAPAARIQEWTEKRVFFLTPQVLTNDLARAAIPSDQIKCLVLDEAHRATGNHAYCQVVKALKEQQCTFRILALSATPGSDMRAVQQVIQNLMISHIELRSEGDPDLAAFTHQRHIEKIVVPLGSELTRIQSIYQNVLRVYVNKLIDMKVVYTRDETTISKFQIFKAREAFRQNPPDMLPRNKYGVAEGLFALSITLYHAYELLLQHGVRSFYKFLKGTLEGEKGSSMAKGELKRNIVFTQLMELLAKKYDTPDLGNSLVHNSSIHSQFGSPKSSKLTPNKEYVVSHPKMEELRNIVVKHHQKFSNEGKSTRVMIFSQYRDSVLEITEMLQCHEPLVKAMSFVGQSTVARGTKGITQKEQMKVVKEFKDGGYNTLISTCVGEEGLDIGEVDLIVCYDAPKSPIRLVQRIGRTGRKREGRIVILVTKGKEEKMYDQSQWQKKNINKALANNQNLSRFLYPNNARMVPRGITPVCHKLHMKIGTWETKTKKERKSISGTKSLTSSLLGNTSQSKKYGMVGMLNREEWQWWRDNLWVPQEEVKTVPTPVFISLNKEEQAQREETTTVNLGYYQPWQTMLQKSHVLRHSTQSDHLVQLTQFIDLQVNLDPEDDPYGLEMQAFLDMSYVEDKEKGLKASICAAASKTEPVRKRKTTKAEKTKKSIQSNLITNMFSQKDQKKNEEDDAPQQEDLDDFLISPGKNPKELVHNNNDDVVNDLNESNKDLLEEFPSSSKEKERGTSENLDNPSMNNEESLVPLEKWKPEDISTAYEDISKMLLSSACRSVRPLDIITPPGSIASDEEIEQPCSPSEVFEVVDEWMAGREMARDQLEAAGVVEKVSSLISKMLEKQEPFSVTSTIHRNSYPFPSSSQFVNKQSDSDEREEVTNIVVDTTPEKNEECEDSEMHEVSPILPSSYRKPVRPNLNLYASTPKLNAKRLFKMHTPNLTCIEQDSSASGSIGKLITEERHEDSHEYVLQEEIMKKNKEARGNKKVSVPLTQRSKVRSKLSMFTVPEVLKSGSESVSGKSENSVVSDQDVSDGIQMRKSNDTSGTSQNSSKDQGINICANSTADRNMQPVVSMRNDNRCDESIEKDNKCLNVEIFISSRLHKEHINEEQTSTGSSPAKEECSVNFDLDNDLFADLDLNVPEESRTAFPPEEIKAAFPLENPEPVFHTPQKPPLSIPKKLSGASSLEKSRQNLLTVTQIIDLVEDSDDENDLFDNKDISKQKNKCSVIEESCKSGEDENKKSDVSRYSMLSKRQLIGRYGLKSPSSNNKLKSSDNESLVQKSMDAFQNPNFSLLDEDGFDNEMVFDNDISKDKLCSKNSPNTSSVTKQATAAQAKKIEIIPLKSSESVKALEEPNFSLDTDFDQNKTIDKVEDQKSQVKTLGQMDMFGKEDFEPMSESLLADIEWNIKLGEEEKKKNKKEVSFSVIDDKSFQNTSLVMLSDKFSPVHRRKGIMEINKKDNTLIGTQGESQVWKRTKRKLAQIVNSDSDEELEISKTETKSATTSFSSAGNASTDSEKRIWKGTGPKDKTINVFDHDDDFEDDKVCLQSGPKYLKQPEVKKRCHKKRNQFLENEAELSEDGENVSSDESDGEHMDHYDESFVDDCTQQTQDAAVDMRAVYLQSVVSPKLAVNRRPGHPVDVLSDTDEEDSEESEEEDSFVVDNNFVEYDTEYMGDTMLAEDSIMIKAMHDHANARKVKQKKGTEKGKKKRKRIILDNSSSEEENVADHKKLKRNNDSVLNSKNPNNTKKQSENFEEQHQLITGNNDSVLTEAKGKLGMKTAGKSNATFGRGASSSISVTSSERVTKHTSPMNNGNIIELSSSEEDFDLQYQQQMSLKDRVLRKMKPLVSNVKQKNDLQKQKQETSVNEENALSISFDLGTDGCDFEVDEQNLKKNISEVKKHYSSKGREVSAAPTTPKVTISMTSTSCSPSVSSALSSVLSEKPRLEDDEISTRPLILIDSVEINNAGSIATKLRLQHRINTSVVQLVHANYIVSKRMGVTRLLHSAFVSSQQKAKLIQRVQGMLHIYDRAVLIIESDRVKPGESPHHLSRSRYADTITCACTHVKRLKVLYSRSQEDTSQILWQLVNQEKTKGFSIHLQPSFVTHSQKMLGFYKSLPRITYASALYLAHNFRNVTDFINSSVVTIQEKGCISYEKASEIKQYLIRKFRADMLPST